MEWHKKNIFDFHLMKYDYPVLNYKINETVKGFHIEPVKTNNRPPGLHGPEYEHMDASQLMAVYKAK